VDKKRNFFGRRAARTLEIYGLLGCHTANPAGCAQPPAAAPVAPLRPPEEHPAWRSARGGRRRGFARPGERPTVSCGQTRRPTWPGGIPRPAILTCGSAPTPFLPAPRPPR